jgi:hypothetical protein
MTHEERAEIVARSVFAKDWEQLAHTARVVTQLRKLPDVTDEEAAVAWLHDVVEDSPVHYVDLLDMGFPQIIIDAVRLITRDSIYLEDYGAYKERLFAANGAAGTIARRVKLADARENYERCQAAAGVPKWERLGQSRYLPMINALEAALGVLG